METEIKTDVADLSKKYFFIVSNALIDHCADLKINSVQLHLLLTIIRHAFQNDSAYPSIPSIQRKTGLSQPTIISNFKKLEEKGYITKTQQFRNNKGQSNNLYSFKSLNNILDRLIKGENIQDILTPLKEINPPSKEYLETPLKEINPLNNTYKNNNINIKTHTYLKQESCRQTENNVCEKIESNTPLKTVELFKNEDEHVLAVIGKRKDALIAAKYLNYQAEKGKIVVRNPCALLIKTLKDELYSDIDEIIEKEKKERIYVRQRRIQKIQEKKKEEKEDKEVEKYISNMTADEKQRRISQIKKNLQCQEQLKDGFAILKLKSEIRKELIDSS